MQEIYEDGIKKYRPIPEIGYTLSIINVSTYPEAKLKALRDLATERNFNLKDVWIPSGDESGPGVILEYPTDMFSDFWEELERRSILIE